MKTKNRKMERMPCNLDGYIIELDQYSDDVGLDMLTLTKVEDISESGIRVKTSLQLDIEGFVLLVILYKGRKSVCFCQVRWVENSSSLNAYGLYFREWSYLHPSLAEKFGENKTLNKLFKLKEWMKQSTKLRRKAAQAA